MKRQQESYTPGHNENATDFMAKRSLESHGGFFIPFLISGVSVLDCGCGPGTITAGIAARVAPGQVLGVDFEQSQIDRATANATRQASVNVQFETANCCALPHRDRTFDRVFSHALMEHLPDPLAALSELYRVLRAGGIIGVCSPDWGGFIVSPPSAGLSHALQAYTTLQSNNGGDVWIGRKLGIHLAAAGFQKVYMSARYECYDSPELIGEYLAQQLSRGGGHTEAANTLRAWSRTEGAMFAQTWISAVGTKK